MPPWHATESHGTFANNRRLSDAEKNTLIAWVDAGAPHGDPKDLPPTPKCAERWQIGKPDVVLSIPKPLDVAESGAIAYQFFTVPTNFTEDKSIQALEIRPGERSVAHHILVFVKAPGARVRRRGSCPCFQRCPACRIAWAREGRPEPAMCLL